MIPDLLNGTSWSISNPNLPNSWVLELWKDPLKRTQNTQKHQGCISPKPKGGLWLENLLSPSLDMRSISLLSHKNAWMFPLKVIGSMAVKIINDIPGWVSRGFGSPWTTWPWIWDLSSEPNGSEWWDKSYQSLTSGFQLSKVILHSMEVFWWLEDPFLSVLRHVKWM